jgi:hypothetical protein
MSAGSGEDEPTEAVEVDLDEFVGEPPAGDARRDEFMSDDQSAPRAAGQQSQAQEPTESREDDQ